jgi:benzoyl-CoA reductase/2-hydroxyglutaryl-CoA dehydratase subunit BcrC/BadD/HgdB
MLMKEKMSEAGIPMLILDGDALDRRNNHDGQVKTRFEAFLELIGQEDRS